MAKKHRSLREALRAVPSAADLSGYDTGATPCSPGGKGAALKALTDKTGPALASLQERLFAESTAGGTHRILLVLQGMDTSGKGGVVEHVMGQLGPAGTKISSFKRPTAQEAAHHFLWRIRRQVPAAGQIGVFDRSHYEDVLIVKVHRLIDAEECERRYKEIKRFESELVAAGTTIIKCFLNISFATQRERLIARLDDPSKHWKFNVGDIDERQFWPDYQSAYAAALQRTSTDAAPWYVIPSDHKWYRNWAISELLLETLTALAPAYPVTDLDVPALKARLAAPN